MSCQIQLANQVAFGGNTIHFNIVPFRPCQVSSANVNLIGSLYQHWTTTHTRTTGSGKNRKTHRYTVHHRKTTVLVNMTIPILSLQQQGNFGPGQPISGQFMLSPFTLPSIDHHNCKLQYSLTAHLSSSSGMMQSPPAPFVVLVPMSHQTWTTPSARAESKHEDVVCCCCVPRGKISLNFRMSKTVIALDRDQIEVEVDIDNSAGEAKVDCVNFVLQCYGRVTGVGGTHPASFAMEAGRARLEGCEAHQTKTVKAVMPLRPLAPPTFSSPIITMAYKITAHVDLAWAHDVHADFDNVLVAHSVDFGNQFQMNQFQQFQPMVNPQQPMMYQPPPPPPGGGHVGFDLTPSSFFTQLPPIKFEQLPPDGEAEGEESGDGDNVPPPPQGYNFGATPQQQQTSYGTNSNNNGILHQPLM